MADHLALGNGPVGDDVGDPMRVENFASAIEIAVGESLLGLSGPDETAGLFVAARLRCQKFLRFGRGKPGGVVLVGGNAFRVGRMQAWVCFRHGTPFRVVEACGGLEFLGETQALAYGQAALCAPRAASREPG